jgi:drug/metabolite transporter (DMT)-like permease
MKNTSKGLLITSIGALVISFEALFIKFTTVKPLVFSFYIGICMFVSMFVILLFKKQKLIEDIHRKSFKFALLGAVLMAVSNLFFISAIKSTLTANVVLILAIAPIFASFFSFIIFKTKPLKSIYIASFFIFIGLFIIFNDQLGLGEMRGNIYAFICAILFSLSFVFLSQYPDINRTSLIGISGIVLVVMTFFLTGSLAISLKDLGYILFMGLLITPISRLLIANGTKFISASEVSLLMIIETIMAPIWVWIFLKEIPSSNTFLGGALIILTLLINSIYTMRKAKRI